MNHMNKSFKLISVLVVLGLLFVMLPIRDAQAVTYITWIAQVPASPAAGQTVRVWMNSDTAPGERACVEYKIGDDTYILLGTYDDSSYPGANWYADIPEQPVGTVVQYRLFIRNDLDMPIFEPPNNWSYTVADAPSESTCTTDCYVDASVGSDINPGNLTTPLETIQKAIESVTLGGTVHVAAGTYTNAGAVLLNKAGVNLHLAAGTIIQNSSACFTVSANNAHIYADSPSAAKCVPTSGSNGIDVAAAVQNLRAVNLEFDGVSGTVGTQAQDGIHFAGTVTNFQIINNYFHGFAGDAIEFVGAPAGIVQDIQGNYFLGNSGQGVKVPTSATVNATYNSWGTYADPALTGVITSPNTHAELFISPEGSMEVLKDSTVVFIVKGKIQSLTGAEFELSYPSQLQLVSAVANSATWSLTPSVDTATPGKIKVRLSSLTPQSGEAVDMLTLMFTATTFSDDLALSFSETADSFAMNPDPVLAKQVSNFVFTFTQTGAANIDIYGLPVITVNATGPYYVSSSIPLEVMIDNINGGSYAGLNLAFNLPAGSVLQYDNGTTWVSATSPFTVGNLSPDQILNLHFRVTLSTLGSNDIKVALMNGEAQLVTGTANVSIDGNFEVTGTFAMEGRTLRSGIPVSFSLPTYSPPAVLTIDQLVNNLSATLLYNGNYTIITNQSRYLNLTADLAKTVVVPRVLPLNDLTLRGGNVTDETGSVNEVDLADATMIGLAYGQTGKAVDLLADANFDGKVNIQDLAIVGGNFELTAAAAYSSWVP